MDPNKWDPLVNFYQKAIIYAIFDIGTKIPLIESYKTLETRIVNESDSALIFESTIMRKGTTGEQP